MDVKRVLEPDAIPSIDGLEFGPVEEYEGTSTTGRSDDRRRLDRAPARRLFTFGWQDDHGSGAFWSG